MRILDFEVRSAGGSFEARRGTLAELLCKVPYLFVSGLIPPLAVMNELLETGGGSGGMSGGCQWQPFKIDAPEHKELVEHLCSSSSSAVRTLTFVEPPQWVQILIQWNAWVDFYQRGIPVEKNLRLANAMAEVEHQLREATVRGRDDCRVQYILEFNKLCAEHSELVHAYPAPKRD